MNNTNPQTPDLGRPDAPTISNVRHLGARGALYLLALVRSHLSGTRLAPTLEGTHSVLAVLATLGLIRVDHHLLSTRPATIGDKVPWSYTWPYAEFAALEANLQEYLTNDARDPTYASTWLSVWQELLPQEVAAYLQHQLHIHRFGDFFLSELEPLFAAHGSTYCLGHWRYACWAAVRSMASVSLQYPSNVEILKFTLGSELSRRLRLAQGAPEGKLCFSPSHSLPDSALVSVFSTVATGLGDRFWMSPPDFEPILGSMLNGAATPR